MQNLPSEITAQSFLQHMAKCGKYLKSWGQDTFGKIKTNSQRIQDQISFLHTQVGDSSITYSIQELENKLDYLLALDEAYWKQRARAD